MFITGLSRKLKTDRPAFAKPPPLGEIRNLQLVEMKQLATILYLLIFVQSGWSQLPGKKSSCSFVLSQVESKRWFEDSLGDTGYRQVIFNRISLSDVDEVSTQAFELALGKPTRRREYNVGQGLVARMDYIYCLFENYCDHPRI
jgi:hypothetical protein